MKIYSYYWNYIIEMINVKECKMVKIDKTPRKRHKNINHKHDYYLVDIDERLTRMCHGCNFSEEIQ